MSVDNISDNQQKLLNMFVKSGKPVTVRTDNKQLVFSSNTNINTNKNKMFQRDLEFYYIRNFDYSKLNPFVTLEYVAIINRGINGPQWITIMYPDVQIYHDEVTKVFSEFCSNYF
jgi:hypothetical protein